MKFLTLIAAFAMAVASTQAAECSADKVSGLQSNPTFTKVQTACANAISTARTATTSEDAKKICKDSECLTALDAASKLLPDCTVQGMNLKDTFEQQFKVVKDACKDLGAPAAAPASSASTTALSAVAAAAAMVVLVQQ